MVDKTLLSSLLSQLPVFMLSQLVIKPEKTEVLYVSQCRATPAIHGP